MSDPARDLELWWRAVDLRTEWLNYALCTEPADRRTAEDAITGLYALLERPRPEFVWVGSPAAAVAVVPPPPPLVSDGPWALENRMATLVSTLRERLRRRVGVPRDPPSVVARSRSDPLAALRSGEPLPSIMDREVRGALRRIVKESIAGPIRAEVSQSLGLAWYGQHETDWVAHYDVHRRVMGTHFDAADTAQLELWARLARSCGWWWPREDMCVIAERPTAIRTEQVSGGAQGEVRLHDADGAAVAFPDGWTVHSWHGTRVPSWVITAPTVELIASEPNVEVRRCAIERVGWTTFIDGAGLVLVGRTPDPGNPGHDLSLYDLPFRQSGAATRLLLAVNGSVERDGTRRRYGLQVPHWFDDPVDAAGWSYGLIGPQYARLQRRT